MREDFEHWWDKEGQFSELCGKELCLIAWSNGEYKAVKQLSDEEIMEWAEKSGLTQWLMVNPLYSKEGQMQVIKSKVIDFARAIIKEITE